MSGRPTTKTKTKENDELVDINPRPHQAEYLQQKTVQKGYERLERHPVSGYRGLPRKSGHGGKYTWEGPRGEEDDFPAAIDEHDPNFIDDAQEQRDREVADGVVEAAKVPAAPQGVARIDVILPHPHEADPEPESESPQVALT
uniref:Hyaluronan/mRNA-binding protein domain-containing protein n=1 Tax=Picea sitchensis TaxID=3332 RepID=D5AC55_PICSI|nr:unknown [Picea sitchensis]